MGVVRDVTIEQLTQAVQGISSTGISDSTGQAINNTLGTLGKDTSLQGIITAIGGLGQTLGSDKANIDGSNIADKAAFRNAINVKEIKSINFTGTTDAAGNLLIPTITVSNATPLVVITSNGYAAGFVFSGNNYYVKLIKNGITELTNTTVSAYVFYI